MSRAGWPTTAASRADSEAHPDATEALMAGVRERMSQAAELRVPLKVDVGIGDNWDQAH